MFFALGWRLRHPLGYFGINLDRKTAGARANCLALAGILANPPW